MNDSEPSTSNQPTQEDSANERLYEWVNKEAFSLPQPFNHDNTFGDGSLRNNRKELEETGGYVIQPDTEELKELEETRGYVIQPETEELKELEETGGYVIQPDTEDTHVLLQSPQYEVPTGHQYEYPDKRQSHQYEYPSLKSTEADTKEKTDVCTQEGAYSALIRPPLNKNESENGGYTSLIKDKNATDKVGTTAKKDKTNGDYTPLVRPSSKDKESEDSYYTSLIKNDKTNDKAVTKAKKDHVDELPHVNAIDGDYTPLAKPKHKAPLYQPLLKIRQKELGKPMPPEKLKKK